MTTERISIISAMLAPLNFFAERCDDKSTLLRLIEIAPDFRRCEEAPDLFQEIRQKTLAAEKRDDRLAIAQFAFEESCAKTLYNLTNGPAPYDADSPFWILPRALELGRLMGVADPADISPLLRTS